MEVRVRKVWQSIARLVSEQDGGVLLKRRAMLSREDRSVLRRPIRAFTLSLRWEDQSFLEMQCYYPLSEQVGTALKRASLNRLDGDFDI